MASNESSRILMEILLKYFSDFTDLQLKQFSLLEELYADWNSKINVISRKDMEGLYERHVLHSLAIAAVFDFPAGLNIIDIGTGGGFPGIPLAIYFPDVHFHLVDSIGKKLKVVENIASAIGLSNVTIQQVRAEDIKNSKFDFAVTRAVAPLAELWKWSRPLLKKAEYQLGDEIVSSGLICLKGGDLAAEIAATDCRPKQLDIHNLFPEEFFQEKYILYVSRS